MSKKGLLGVLVVTLAISATILIGFALNVEQGTETRTDYDLVTDVTGLFEFSDQPQYIDYTPPSNYNGYSLSSIDGDPKTFTNNASINVRMIKDGSHSGVMKLTGSTLNITCDGITLWNGPYVSSYSPVCGWKNGHNEINGGNFYNYLGQTNPINWSYNNGTLIFGSKTITSTYFWIISNLDEIYGMNGFYGANSIYYVNDINDFYCATLGASILYQDGNTAYIQGNNTSATFTIPNVTNVEHYNLKSINNIASYHPVHSGTTYNFFYAIAPKELTKNIIPSPGITYTESNTANNYPIGTTSTSSERSVTLTGSLPQHRYDDFYIQVSLNFPAPPAITTAVNYFFKNPYITTVSELIASLNAPEGTTDIILDTRTSTTTFSSGGSSMFLANNVVFFPASKIIDGKGTTQGNQSGNFSYNAVYHNDTGIVDIYRGSVLDGSYPAASTYVAWGGTAIKRTDSYTSGNVLISSTEQAGTITPATTANLKVTINATEFDYIKISEGISINNANAAYYTSWSNAPYTDAVIQILFRSPTAAGTYSNELTLSSGEKITITNGTGGASIQINDNEAVSIGQWRSFILNIDKEAGTINAIPVKEFGTFTQYSLYDTVIEIGSIQIGTFTGINWSATSNSWQFLVVNTKVFMNTYSAVMTDPHIEISNYFTDLNNEYRLNLYSFALYGNSITINGEEYTVSNGYVTIDDQQYKMSNLYITYENGKCFITFVNDRVTLDLGETTDYVLSFGGNWYFTSDLYKGVNKTVTLYNWKWDNFNISMDAAILVFIGCSAIGIAIVAKYKRISLLDIAIIVIAGICALSLLGGLI